MRAQVRRVLVFCIYLSMAAYFILFSEPAFGWNTWGLLVALFGVVGFVLSRSMFKERPEERPPESPPQPKSGAVPQTPTASAPPIVHFGERDLEDEVIGSLAAAVANAQVKEGTVLSVEVNPKGSGKKKLTLAEGQKIDFVLGAPPVEKTEPQPKQKEAPADDSNIGELSPLPVQPEAN